MFGHFSTLKGKVTESTNQSKHLLYYQTKCVSSFWAACCSKFVNETWTYTVSIQSRNLIIMTSLTPVELVTRMIAASQSQTVQFPLTWTCTTHKSFTIITPALFELISNMATFKCHLFRNFVISPLFAIIILRGNPSRATNAKFR